MTFNLRLMLATLCLSLANTTSVAEPVVLMRPQLTQDAAYRAARGVITECRALGYQVAVTVVDAAGQAQVVLRDDLARPLALAVSAKKASTAASFGRSTSSLSNGEAAIALGSMPELLFAGGGIPIVAAGTVIGALGVSGAPTAATDERCAQSGISAISDDLDFFVP